MEICSCNTRTSMYKLLSCSRKIINSFLCLLASFIPFNLLFIELCWPIPKCLLFLDTFAGSHVPIQNTRDSAEIITDKHETGKVNYIQCM